MEPETRPSAVCRIYPVARRRMIEIGHYMDKTSGGKQADKYIRGLYKARKTAASNKYLWRKVGHEEIAGVCFIRYEHHYLFFRELPKGVLSVVNVLHENMDVPAGQKDDSDKQ